MSIKKFFKRIASPVLDDSLAKQERTFYLLAFVALTAFAFAIVVTALMHFSTFQVLVRVAMWLFFLILAVTALKFHKTKIAIYISATFLTFILLPFNFFSGGGINGGCAIWNLFGLICVLYLIESNFKFVLLAGNISVFAACCVAERFRPDLLASYDADTLFSKSVISAYIVSIIVFLLILFQSRLSKIENERSQRQKKEIEELSLAQNRFFSSMSHEIRTPINTIIGLNEMIQRNATSEEVAEDAVRVQSAGKMLLSLVNDILDISKMEAGRMEISPAPYDTGAMLSEIANMMWFPAKEKGLEFNLSIGENIPARLVGDDGRIKQVLINILNNAVKYTQKGSVTLSVQCEKGAAEGMVYMVYSVIDTGMGIKRENIAHLFDVFKRVDIEKTRRIEGTGLGLAIVKQLLDLMGGTVEVNSVYTKGSNFTVRLPQKAEGNETVDGEAIRLKHRAASEAGRVFEFTAPGARVLIVDDNESNLLVAQKLLRETKAKIDTATSGPECLKKTLQIHYDVIFMDYLMPEMDGIECLREIRRQRDGLNAETPVVALTADAGSDAQALYKREGFDGILVKPVTGRQLEAQVLRHLPSELIKAGSLSAIQEFYESPVLVAEHKVPILIATDASADIPKPLVHKHNIALLPVEIETGEGSFLDGIEVDQDGIMSYLARGGKKAAAIDQTKASYLSIFPHLLDRAQRVIYLSTSDQIITSYPAACETARSFESVTVFDSRQVSSGLGLLAVKAAELAEAGNSVEKILEALEGLRERIQTSFVVNDTRYLLAAGKVSRSMSRACDALLLHPVLAISKGRMKATRIEFGTQNGYWKNYIWQALREPKTIDKSEAILTYVAIDKHRLQEIEAEVKRLVDFERIYFQKASAAISASCGPGSFGITLMRDRRIWS